MSVLLHLSDTHFGTERPQVVKALVSLAVQQRPDVVVLSGDITQRARPHQFQAAKRFVDRLGAPVLAIPGNHDIPLLDLWARFTHPYGRYATVFGTDVEPVYSSPDWLVVGVNTTRAGRHRHGEVSPAQVARVAGLLAAAAPGQLRVVVLHQPLAVADAAESVHVVRGHAHAARAWAQAGADVVLGGHIHLPFAMLLSELARPLWVVQAGTAVSSRTRPGVPNSVNVLRWCHASPAFERDRSCVVERWDFDTGQQAFVCQAATTIRLERPSAPG